MNISLATAEVIFKTGKRVVVSQENWDIGMRFSEAQRQSKINPLEDKRLQYFRENLYPALSSASSGDVPTLEEAYAMLENDQEGLGKWYSTNQELNPDWYNYIRHNKPVEVVFADGTKIVVVDGNRPVFIMRLADLERAAQEFPSENISIQLFRSGFYPKMAGCSIGGFIPNDEEARAMPTTELNKWYEAAKAVNPHWFAALNEIAEAAQAQNIKKKKPRKRK